MVHKLRTVVFVEAIEPALVFWKGLGFEKVVEVPHEEALGFVILVRDGLELMLQSRASGAADLGFEPPPFALYSDVSSVDEARAAVVGAEVLIDRRTTFYGATESWVRDPAGTLIAFAEHPG